MTGSPSNMANPLKEMPKVAFTRAEMPQDHQTEFYKQHGRGQRGVGERQNHGWYAW
jgi:hypothetical protein